MGNANRLPVQSWYLSEVVNCDWYTTEVALRAVEFVAVDVVDTVAAIIVVTMLCRPAAIAAGSVAGK